MSLPLPLERWLHRLFDSSRRGRRRTLRSAIVCCDKKSHRIGAISLCYRFSLRFFFGVCKLHFFVSRVRLGISARCLQTKRFFTRSSSVPSLKNRESQLNPLSPHLYSSVRWFNRQRFIFSSVSITTMHRRRGGFDDFSQFPQTLDAFAQDPPSVIWTLCETTTTTNHDSKSCSTLSLSDEKIDFRVSVRPFLNLF